MGGSFTLYLEESFWVGVAERTTESSYEIARVVFGSEPSDAELVRWALREFHLLRYRRVQACDGPRPRQPSNPKRAQRDAEAQLRQRGPGTRAQQALKLALAQSKVERRAESRAERLADAERRRALRRQKRKEKHRGH